MPNKKNNPYRLKEASTPNPLKEMSWCINNNIIINTEPEGKKVGKYWETTGMYRLVARQGSRERATPYEYTKDTVMDALYEAYRKTYAINHGKETKE